MDKDFMKKQPVFPLIMSMSLPMVISMLVNSLYNIIDSFFVAKISDDAMTALSLVFPVQNFIRAEKIEYPVRKAAHMTEYAILGLLSFAFYRGILKKEKRQFLVALLTAAVYAATDEFHQYFIPGRSAEVMDVCIDTLGASIGLAILFFTLKVVRKHCQKSKLTLQ